MARLSAHGSIVWRAIKRVDNPNAAIDSLEAVYREKHYALMSDGKMLEKLIVGHYSMFDNDRVERHDYGWKLARGKVKSGLETFAGAQMALEPKGFVVTAA